MTAEMFNRIDPHNLDNTLTFSVSRAKNCLGVGLGEEWLDSLLRDEHELSLEAESESESYELRELLSESLKRKVC